MTGSPVNRSLHKTRPRWPAALIVVLLLHSLAPGGYMPASIATGWPVMLCPDGLPDGFLAALSQHPRPAPASTPVPEPVHPAAHAHHHHKAHGPAAAAGAHALHAAIGSGSDESSTHDSDHHSGHASEHSGSHSAQNPYCPLGNAADQPVLGALAVAHLAGLTRPVRWRSLPARTTPLTKTPWSFVARAPPARSQPPV